MACLSQGRSLVHVADEFKDVLALKAAMASDAVRERHGITREAVWIQQTPGGDVAVVLMEAKDLEAAFKGVAASDDPFDRWFREHVRDVHGINLEEGMTPPEQILDFQS